MYTNKLLLGAPVRPPIPVQVVTTGGDPTRGPCEVSTNFSFDIQGPPNDPGFEFGNITFKPPTGYSVQILRVYGDFATIPNGTPIPGGMCGMLFGIETTAVAASKFADYAADGCFLFVQLFTKGEAQRASYDREIVGVVLAADNVFQMKTACFLNTLGVSMHMEPSLIIVYRFVPTPAKPPQP
jgi:hypothetical protein